MMTMMTQTMLGLRQYLDVSVKTAKLKLHYKKCLLNPLPICQKQLGIGDLKSHISTGIMVQACR